MRGWAALLLVGGLMAVAAWATTGAQAPDHVLAHPSEGEEGHYQTRHVWEGPDGTSRQAGEHVARWRTETVDVPGGGQRELATLEHRFPVPEAAEEGPAVDPLTEAEEPSVQDRIARKAFHHGDLPDPPLVHTTEEIVDDRANGELHVFERITRNESCQGTWAGILADRSPAEARRALERCLTDPRHGAVETTAARTEDPDHGRVWTLTATTDRGRLQLVTSPALGLVLAEQATWTRSTPEGPVEHRYEAELVGYDPGKASLSPDAEPLTPAPTVPTTIWTAEGPREGGAEAYPFAQAREDARTHPTASAYHAENPEAELFTAHLVDRSPAEADDRLDRRGCPPDTGEDPDVSPGAEVPGLAWRFHWAGPEENLLATAERPTTEDPLAEATPADRHASRYPARTQLPGAELPGKGPTLAALWDHVDAREHPGEDAVAFVGIRAAWHGGELVGLAGKMACHQDPVTGEVHRQEAGVRLPGGELTTSFATVFRDEGYTALDVGDLASPEQGTDEGIDPPDELGIAGIAAVATGLTASAATRAAGNLYSRLTGREVLEHETRRALVDAVRARPASTLAELSQRLDLNTETARHHLEMLEREDHLALVRAPAGVVALPPGHPMGEDAAVLAREQARPALAALHEQPGCNLTELADALDVSRGPVSRLVDALVDAGLVTRERDGRSVHLALTELATELVR